MTRLEDFNREYLALHTVKEDLFWTTYMGVQQDRAALESAELRHKAYISDPQNIARVQEAIDQTPAGPEREGLRGWLAFFRANSVEAPEARLLQREIIRAEAELNGKRAQLRMSYANEKNEATPATTNVLSVNIAASPIESVRKNSHDALLGLERWVLANGFLDLVKLRNRFARAQGFKNYFEYRVRMNEDMSVEELFAILDNFEELTRDKLHAELRAMAARKGPSSVLPHNLRFSFAGDAEKDLDPYYPFERAVEVWCETFARWGIGFRGAELTLDLVDRAGKYENGFMHAPLPSYFEGASWCAARINFTSNAVPGQLGSGRRALHTLLHEGGHAAHFSNVTQNAPCFSQEFPPTSMAYAETQSMFCDSVLGDADWQRRYARNRAGQPVPHEIIRRAIELEQPMRAYGERGILVVPVFERQLYEMSDDSLSADAVLKLARECEQKILGVECGPRPMLAIPHLLGSEGACSYQGYLLANMAVYQTRAHFMRKYGYIVDNPNVGPELERAYWNQGNAVPHRETVKRLAGEALSGRELAAQCNLSADERWARAQAAMDSADAREKLSAQSAAPTPASVPSSAQSAAPPTGAAAASPNLNLSLDAKIRIVHGAQEIANNHQSPQQMWRDFEGWIAQQAASGLRTKELS